ncbi:DUF3987 domain-containing protein [Pseudomonas sp. FME51]|uniref:DUF3987 domain-containing protein n=1 Tax=Pseudomonas sp. FME51 TaxID=2742609 RepID=UPI001867B6AC|nr:DUF3987 domain-containing protein [Pseudomonas sp. FME51]
MSVLDKLQPTGQVEQVVPEPLTAILEAATPYPVEALPPLMRDAIKASAHYAQAPLALAGQSILGAAAYLAQTRVNAHSRASNKGQPCSLFMLSLGNSGEGKSFTRDIAFAPINEAEKKRSDEYEQELEEYKQGREGLSGKELKAYEASHQVPKDNRTIIGSDASFSRVSSLLVEGIPALFWGTDEGGQMLSGHSMKADNFVAVLGSMTQLWDSGYCERIRALSNLDASGRVYHRRFTLDLMAQEISIRNVLNDDVMKGQGFLPRFLFTAPESRVGTRVLVDGWHGDDPRIQALWDRMGSILQSPMELGVDNPSEVSAPVLGPTPGAQGLWREFWETTEGRQSKEAFGRYSQLQPFASRAAQIALRLSAVLAHFEGKNHIDDVAMAGAVALAQHSLEEWHRYACATRVDAKTQAAIDMSGWLVKEVQDGKTEWMVFTGREWSRSGYSPLRKADKRDQAITFLLEKKHLLTGDDSAYRLNPLLLESPATGATAATDADKARIGADYSDFLNCDTSATHCDKTGIGAKKQENVAACRSTVANTKCPQSRIDKRLHKSVAVVANVATISASEDDWTGSMTL